MPRVAGCDPGTSGLDLLILQDGEVAEQCRFTPEQLQADGGLPVRWLEQRGPFDLIAGPSGYGLPLVQAQDCTERDLELMSLVRPDDRGRGKGVAGFTGLTRLLRDSGLPVVFLPGVIHLPTVPPHRKINRIDLGTPDKLCAAALAVAQNAAEFGGDYARCRYCVVELGTAFTSCVVVQGGHVVDGLGGTSGPPGWRSAGGWDGEAAYLLGPLTKRDLFVGGVTSVPEREEGLPMFREGIVKAVAGLRQVTPFERVFLSGRLREEEGEIVGLVERDLEAVAAVAALQSLPGAWVKEAAQGAALLADGLAGGRWAGLVERLRLREAGGTVLDWLRHPRLSEVCSALWPAG